LQSTVESPHTFLPPPQETLPLQQFWQLGVDCPLKHIVLLSKHAGVGEGGVGVGGVGCKERRIMKKDMLLENGKDRERKR